MKTIGLRTSLVSLSLLSFAVAVSAAPVRLSASLTGDQETPPTGSTAVGSAQLFVDPATGDYQLDLSITGLVEEVSGIHMHEAAVGVAGAVVVPLDEAAITGDVNLQAATYTGTLDPAVIGPLLTGGTYLNVHTASYPGGEIRGQWFVDEVADGAMLNFSCRGHVNPGNGKAGILIGGFYIGAPGKRVLIRVIGDGLTKWGLNALKDTSFTVFNQAGEPIAANDDWADEGQQYQILATRYAPDQASDAAMILDLPAGGYTVHGDSEQGAGIALVEMYGLTPSSIGTTIKTAANGQLVQEFTILQQALTDTGLAAVLSGAGPYTLFAPTDAAFAALPAGALDDLDTVKAILLHHIVTAKLEAAALATGDVTMGDGGTTAVVVGLDGVTIDGANVLEADLPATNGYIHVIDEVLMP